MIESFDHLKYSFQQAQKKHSPSPLMGFGKNQFKTLCRLTTTSATLANTRGNCFRTLLKTRSKNAPSAARKKRSGNSGPAQRSCLRGAGSTKRTTAVIRTKNPPKLTNQRSLNPKATRQKNRIPAVTKARQAVLQLVPIRGLSQKQNRTALQKNRAATPVRKRTNNERRSAQWCSIQSEPGR